MLIEHILTVYKPNTSKLAIVKKLKEYTGEGLKECKYVADLMSYRDNKITYFEGQSYTTIQSHIDFIHKNSAFRILEAKDGKLVVTFPMEHSKFYSMLSELDKIMVKFKLEGLQEYRNKKIDSLLG